MNLESWLEEQAVITENLDPVTHIKMLDAQGEVWATWGLPIKSEVIHSFKASLSSQLATGRHAFTIIAFSADGDARGRYMETISGGNSAAKAAQTDEITRAKATQMNIDIADRQMQMMITRLEAADKRAALMEERAGEQVELLWKFADKIQEQERSDRMVELQIQEKEAKIEMLKGMGEQLMPLIGFLMPALMDKFGKLLTPTSTGSDPTPSTAPASVSVSPPSIPPTLEPEKPIAAPASDAGEVVAFPSSFAQQQDENPATEVPAAPAKPKRQPRAKAAPALPEALAAKGTRRVAKAPVKPAKPMPKKAGKKA